MIKVNLTLKDKLIGLLLGMFFRLVYFTASNWGYDLDEVIIVFVFMIIVEPIVLLLGYCLWHYSISRMIAYRSDREKDFVSPFLLVFLFVFLNNNYLTDFPTGVLSVFSSPDTYTIILGLSVYLSLVVTKGARGFKK